MNDSTKERLLDDIEYAIKHFYEANKNSLNDAKSIVQECLSAFIPRKENSTDD